MSESVLLNPNSRPQLLGRLAEATDWDLAVVGGGATGLGVALDAAARGYSVVLLESHDFAGGTSSRSTKLLHGGVRYLAQGNVALVREALHERSTVLANAPHLASRLSFIMPSYAWWQTPFYGIGLKLYDLLAGQAGLGPTRFLDRRGTLAALPRLQPQGLSGGVQYWDGQFDDARLALALARTAVREGALLLNYCPVTELRHENGRVTGLRCRDAIGGQSYEVRARCVVNATGVWVDGVRQMDGDAQGKTVTPMVAPSQGVHVVVDRDFLPGDHALLVPKTADGRVLFAVPWLGKLVLGTTDTPRRDLPREPQPLRSELDFILGEAARYLVRPPTPADVRSIWVGLRPLVRPVGDDSDTGSLSREHTVLQASSGLVTVTGGKWTTYRAMAEDVLARCVASGLLPRRPAGVSATLRLVGAPAPQAPAGPGLAALPGQHLYGVEAATLAQLPGAGEELAPGMTEAMVRFAARNEYALTVEDVLARRSRYLFLDAELAGRVAPRVARILEEETGVNPQLAAFQALAQSYRLWPA
ncbi:FAD-dependent oxidoreductase [Hylemonella gracilis str. Niagara R]|uniref:FAD-dependent oxidoreductase n=1 Tax=Hylemonella gracilis str. Niagara R TaxID=1458275 RepID=A0A016XM68_9BURK|nr:glycerol-3-phosphate dehydrogenase/oxidase [Hylemonella gracilis]EYC52657.1 FAD-dependent oxidoreductase [Hylemonella gracilis str. Niagara R]